MPKKKETKEIVEVKETGIAKQDNSVELLISQAIKEKVPVDTMERILAMRRELRAENAKEEYDRAMAEFQANCPIISKTKSVQVSGKTIYSYAPIESIVSQVKALLNQYGFSYAIKAETKEFSVMSTCIAKHVAGHSEDSSVEVPLGNKTGVMSASQVTAAALTFAKRYAFCNAFGILTGDEDNDGKGAGTKEEEVKETPEQKFERAKMLLSSLNDVDKLIDYSQKVLPKSTFTKEQKEELDSLIKIKVDNLTS